MKTDPNNTPTAVTKPVELEPAPHPADAAPAFAPTAGPTDRAALRRELGEACTAWLTKSQSGETRNGHSRDLAQFLRFANMPRGQWEYLAALRPSHVAAWRDHLLGRGLTNTAISRKLSVVRSLFGYLQKYGYAGANPADTAFVAAPVPPRDGKTVALTPGDCRRLLDAPPVDHPEGVRDRAVLAVLAFTGCRVGEGRASASRTSRRAAATGCSKSAGRAGRSAAFRSTPRRSSGWRRGSTSSGGKMPAERCFAP